MSIAVTTRKFTVDEYHTMIQSGILHEDDRVELLEGEIVEMSPISSRHAACVNNFTRLFSTLNLNQKIVLAVQNPIILGSHTEPQPDVALLKPRQDMYQSQHPTAKDIYLLIEVTETSHHIDRDRKLPLYAEAGIAEVWLVDLSQEVVERYLEPQGDAYQRIEKYVAGQELSPQAFPDFRLAVKDILLK